MEALAAAHDAAVQMIDTSVVRVHQHGAGIAANRDQQMGRSCSGLTSKGHGVVDANGLPLGLGLSPGEAHDNRLYPVLLSGLRPKTFVADTLEFFGNGQITLNYDAAASGFNAAAPRAYWGTRLSR